MGMRDEFPRPDFKRNKWESLNGEWKFHFDPEGRWNAEEGIQGLYEKKINVPFCYQAKLSGIGSLERCPVIWYQRSVTLRKQLPDRILLKFGAVDYKASVWINGIYVGSHEGGHTSFDFDITEAAQNGTNRITVQVQDYPRTDQPRGKQTWTGQPFGCWYTETSGIWQSVWIEYVPEIYLKRVKITPDLPGLCAKVELFLSSNQLTECKIRPHMQLQDQEYEFGMQQVWCRNGYGKAVISFHDFDFLRHLVYWSPEQPNLIQLEIGVSGSVNEDKVSTYFGMRSVEIKGKQVLLNQEVIFQKLILDQGYWPDSLMTAPSEEAIIKDLQMIKEMGFQGVRMHQKIEDPLFYYHADRIGLLVWGELPSSYEYNDEMVKHSVSEMTEFVERDYNHPCIVTWVPVNESWGVRDIIGNQQEQAYVLLMKNLIKALDMTRLVSANDGWEQPGENELCTIHDYRYTQYTLGKYQNPDQILGTSVEDRLIYANGHYNGQPVLLTEYGGIAYTGGNAAEKNADEAENRTKTVYDSATGTEMSANGWGYLGTETSEKEFLERLGKITYDIISNGTFAGFCYTQLTDVQQEKNGLLTAERIPKVEIQKLQKIFDWKPYEKKN